MGKKYTLKKSSFNKKYLIEERKHNFILKFSLRANSIDFCNVLDAYFDEISDFENKYLEDLTQKSFAHLRN